MSSLQQQAQHLVQDVMTDLADLPMLLNNEHDAIDLNQTIERAKRKLCALQATATNRFVALRQAQEQARGVPVAEQLKGIDAEIGFSRGESPYVGGGVTHMAMALHTVLPNTLAALCEGRVSEYHARLVADETHHLKAEHRRVIDAAIAHRLGTASSTQLRRLIEGHALRLDRQAADARAARNTTRRRVCADPAGDDLAYVTGTVTTAESLAILQSIQDTARKRLAALQQHHQVSGTDEPLPSLEQLEADIFVERLTGQATAAGVPAEILLVMHDTTLLGDDDLPAWILGHGPISAGAAKDWLSNPEATKFVRRLYTRPEDGQLIGLESRARRFPDGLAKMLRVRDDSCATPWCNNPVRQADHRTPWAQGGPTSWDNGLGLCQRCNLRKEHHGWAYTGTVDELTVTTPTGHQYQVPTRPPLAHIAHWNSDPPAYKITPPGPTITIRLKDAA